MCLCLMAGLVVVLIQGWYKKHFGKHLQILVNYRVSWANNEQFVLVNLSVVFIFG